MKGKQKRKKVLKLEKTVSTFFWTALIIFIIYGIVEVGYRVYAVQEERRIQRETYMAELLETERRAQEILNSGTISNKEADESFKVSIESPEIPREDGYNSLEIVYYNEHSETKLPIEIEIYGIYSKYESYETIEEARRAKVIKSYHKYYNRQYFLIQNGFNISMQINPSVKSDIENWEEKKSNLPIEIASTELGNNRLTSFLIYIDYSDDLVTYRIDPADFD